MVFLQNLTKLKMMIELCFDLEPYDIDFCNIKPISNKVPYHNNQAFLCTRSNYTEDNYKSKFKNLVEMNVVYSSQPVSIKFQLYFVQFNNNASHLIFQFEEW